MEVSKAFDCPYFAHSSCALAVRPLTKLCLGQLGSESIPDSPHGLDASADVAELPSQPDHLRIDRSVQAVEVRPHKRSSRNSREKVRPGCCNSSSSRSISRLLRSRADPASVARCPARSSTSGPKARGCVESEDAAALSRATRRSSEATRAASSTIEKGLPR